MSKITYAEPKVNVIAFSADDILTQSTDAFDGAWVPIGGTGEEDEE